MPPRYVGLSRVRCANDLVLAQTFNPLLFRQGPQIGPDVLTRVLGGHLKSSDTAAEWPRLDRAARARGRNSTNMDLPRALCCKDQPQNTYAVPAPAPHLQKFTWYPTEMLMPMGHGPLASLQGLPQRVQRCSAELDGQWSRGSACGEGDE